MPNAEAPTSPAKLELESPDVIRCGDHVYRCGGITYRLIRHLTRQRRGASKIADLAVAVWGERLGPEISRNTLKGVIHRVNDVLKGIGAGERVSIDRESVLMV